MPVMSAEINELAAALAAAQAEIEGAEKNSANPHLKSRYADLASVWGACRVPLTKNGLAVVQCPRHHSDENGEMSLRLETVLMHKSGQWISSEIPIRPPTAKENDPQVLGSWLTYCRRYGLSAIAGIAPDDDDAEAAMHRGGDRRPPRDDRPRNGNGPERRERGPAPHQMDPSPRPVPAPAPAPAAKPLRTFKQLVADASDAAKMDASNRYEVAKEVLGEAVHARMLPDPGGLLSEEQVYEVVQGLMIHNRKAIVSMILAAVDTVKAGVS